MYFNNDIDYIKYLKKRKVILFGAGKQGQKTLSNLSRYGIKVIAFCDNDAKKQNQRIKDIRVISFEELLEINDTNTMIVISAFERELREQLLMSGVHNFISVSQIEFGGGEEYYDEEYFKWQQKMGIFGAKMKVSMFQTHINGDMTVVEFGSGGGYLLQEIDAKEKIGIEINDTAREAAKAIGIDSVKNISDISDNYADIIISTSVLEHTENPLGILRELYGKLKEGGKIVFHVPNESCDTEYTRSEVNNHLYTWNCLNLGNLFKAAGYFVYSVQKVQEVWPPNYFEIAQEVGSELFEAICSIGGRAFDENRCIIVAYK